MAAQTDATDEPTGAAIPSAATAAHAGSEPRPSSLDHVALWVADRDAIADLACGSLGMHLIERTDSFTLVGVDARLGKLTLFDAPGPREPGVLARVALRVADVERVLSGLPGAVGVCEAADGTVELAGPEGLVIGLVGAAPGQTAYDLDHVALRVPDPDVAAARLAQMGFRDEGGRPTIGDRHLRLIAGDPGPSERPLLNHLALLVDSVDEYLAAGRERGIEVDEFKDAANTYAAFVWGPDRIKLEYVEHKPGFALV